MTTTNPYEQAARERKVGRLVGWCRQQSVSYEEALQWTDYDWSCVAMDCGVKKPSISTVCQALETLKATEKNATDPWEGL